MRSALQMKQRGFTLIELLIAISIIAIITGASIPNFNTYIRNQNVKQAQLQVKDDLRTVQNRALNGQEATKELNGDLIQYWGVRFVQNSGSYTYFTSVNDTTGCDSALPTIEDYRTSEILPGGNVIRNTNGCIFFSLANGDATGIQTVIVGPDSGSSTGCKRVEISPVGLIKAEDTDETCN